MGKTCEEIRNDWKEIRSKIGNLINAMDAKIDEKGNYDASYELGWAQGYDDGLSSAWDVARRIINHEEQWDIWNLKPGECTLEAVNKYSAEEAIRKLAEYDYNKRCEEAKTARQKIIIEDLKEMYRKYGPDEVFEAQKEIDLEGR